MPLSLLIADDHPIVLGGLRALIESTGKYEVVAEVSTGRDALDAMARLSPDIAVLDLNMPAMDGIEVLQQAISLPTVVPTVIIAASASDVQIYRAVETGARGFVFKDTAPHQLVACLDEVAAGRLWFPSEVVHSALKREKQRRITWEIMLRSLTPRERQVVDLVTRGRSNKEIAFALLLSEGTVKVHLNNIFRKLEITSRSDLSKLVSGRHMQPTR